MIVAVRRDGRERLAKGDTLPSASAALSASNVKTLGASNYINSYLLGIIMVMITVPTVSGFGVIPSTTPRSMENLVLGTVALPNLDKPEQLLSDAYELGFRRFDLARTYGMGKSEKIFGNWMDNGRKAGFLDREQICVVTKGGMGNDKYGDPDRELCTRQSLREELTASLTSLKTDYADLYMLHRDDPRIETCDFVEWMNDLVKEGLINRWGVSNWSWERVKSACDYASMTGKVKPTATSPQLSLAVPNGLVWPSTHSVSCPSQMPEVSWYEKEGVEVMGWEALAKGFMAVPDLWSEIDHDFVHGPDAEIGSNEWRSQRIQRAYCTPENYERRSLAHQLAKDSGLSLAQISLLFSLQKGDHVSVLVGAETRGHLEEMSQLRGWALDKEAFDSLSAATFLPQNTYTPDVAKISANLMNAMNATVPAYA